MTDYEMILICALRYALGRRSYMVWIVTNYIDAVIQLEGLSDICKAAMITEIEQTPDYGDSFVKVRAKYPEAILIRLEDKMSRLEQLMQHGNRRVKDESVEDTLLDLANYCIMELVERKNDTKSKEKEAE